MNDSSVCVSLWAGVCSRNEFRSAFETLLTLSGNAEVLSREEKLLRTASFRKPVFELVFWIVELLKSACVDPFVCDSGTCIFASFVKVLETLRERFIT